MGMLVGVADDKLAGLTSSNLVDAADGIVDFVTDGILAG